MSAESHRLTIERLSYGPAGVGRLDGKVVFVPGTVPGDTVEVAIEEEKKTYAVARLVAVLQPSAQRRQPPCPYVPRCGGCPWQHIDYAEQLRAKQALVEEHLRRIGGLPTPPVLPIIPSPRDWHYRHRIRLRSAPGPAGLLSGALARSGRDRVVPHRRGDESAAAADGAPVVGRAANGRAAA